MRFGGCFEAFTTVVEIGALQALVSNALDVTIAFVTADFLVTGGTTGLAQNFQVVDQAVVQLRSVHQFKFMERAVPMVVV